MGNISGGGTERLLPTTEVLGNELPMLYSEHFKWLIFSIQLSPVGEGYLQLLIFLLWTNLSSLPLLWGLHLDPTPGSVFLFAFKGTAGFWSQYSAIHSRVSFLDQYD